MAKTEASIYPTTIARLSLVALTLAFLVCLIGNIPYPAPAAATVDEVKWCRVNIPVEGETGHWVLASGLDVRHLAMAVDGTL